MNADIKALVVDWMDVLNRHDPDAAAAFFTEDCVFANVGTVNGSPAVLRYGTTTRACSPASPP